VISGHLSLIIYSNSAGSARDKITLERLGYRDSLITLRVSPVVVQIVSDVGPCASTASAIKTDMSSLWQLKLIDVIPSSIVRSCLDNSKKGSYLLGPCVRIQDAHSPLGEAAQEAQGAWSTMVIL
jgi:hypothetical protein